jgi:hypothetical protein
VLALSTSRNTDDADNVLHDYHACTANNEDLATAKTLDCPKGNRRGEDVDKRGNEAYEEGIADSPEGGKEDCAEVEDEVDTGKLLHHLHKDT